MLENLAKPPRLCAAPDLTLKTNTRGRHKGVNVEARLVADRLVLHFQDITGARLAKSDADRKAEQNEAGSREPLLIPDLNLNFESSNAQVKNSPTH